MPTTRPTRSTPPTPRAPSPGTPVATAPLAARPPRPRRLPPTAGFALVAVLLVLLLAASSAPSPLYPLYAARWGASASALTAVFAVYALALLLALVVGGRVSDHVGRRPVLLVALVVELASMLVFLDAGDVTDLLVARAVQGAATGLAISTGGAVLLDLTPPGRPALGGVVNAVAPPAGLAVGALGSGLLVQLAPAPTRLVFAVLALAFLVLLLLVVALPESVARQPGARASLRPQLAVPAPARRAFAAATPLFVATWAMGALYLSLGPSLVADVLHDQDRLVGGLVVTAFAGVGAVASAVGRDAHHDRLAGVGSTALAAGTVVALTGLAAGSLPVFFVGTAVAGVGFGAAFSGALRSVVAAARPHERAGLLTAVYIVSYLAFSLPALVAGELVPSLGLRATAIGYGAVVVVLTVIALAGSLVRRMRGPDSAPPQDAGS